MSALVIVDLTVTNQDKFEEYRSKGPSTVEKYGGEFIANGEVLTLHGQSLYEMKVVIQFPERFEGTDTVRIVKR